MDGMDWNARTIQTYDESAEELAQFFNKAGARIDDIELALKLAGATSNARAVEIGCGDGRDAAEITKRVAWYEGFDPSEGLLHIARNKLPGVSFVKADALSYNYPENLDIVYASASLLHVSQEDLRVVLAKVATSLRKGGIAFLSLKERLTYEVEIQNDQYGKRVFYYYNPALVRELAGHAFTVAHEYRKPLGQTQWFGLALQKN